METKFKDPQAKLPFRGDWTAWLDKEGDDTISTSTWSVTPEGDVITSGADKDATSTIVWLAGGTAGKRYTVTNHIVTVGGLEDDRSFILDVRQR